MRARSGWRSSAARFFAAMNRSSGISTVVFIREIIFLYLWHVNCLVQEAPGYVANSQWFRGSVRRSAALESGLCELREVIINMLFSHHFLDSVKGL